MFSVNWPEACCDSWNPVEEDNIDVATCTKGRKLIVVIPASCKVKPEQSYCKGDRVLIKMKKPILQMVKRAWQEEREYALGIHYIPEKVSNMPHIGHQYCISGHT